MLAKTALIIATVFASAALTASARPFTRYPVGSPGEVSEQAYVGQEAVARQQKTEQQAGRRPAARPMAEHDPQSESDDESDGEETEVESRQLPRAHEMHPTHMEPPGVQPPLMEAHAVQPAQVTTVSQPELPAGAHPATPQVEAQQPMTEQVVESDDESDGEETADESHRKKQQRAHGVRPPQMEAHGMQPTQMEAHTVQAAQMTTIIQPGQAAGPTHSKSATGSQHQEAVTNDNSDHNPGDDHPTHVETAQPPQIHAAEPTHRDVHGRAASDDESDDEANGNDGNRVHAENSQHRQERRTAAQRDAAH